MRIVRLLAIACALGGCGAATGGPAASPTAPSAAATPQRSPAAPSAPSPTSQEVPTMAVVPGSNAERVVRQHAADFAVDPASIAVISDEEVTWPSSGLGCEKPGQMYMTVLTDGFQVIIEQGGRRYDYHAGRNGIFFLCEQPK